MALAVICWMEDKDGAPEGSTTGRRYVGVARFEGEARKWPNEAWSLVADFKGSPDGSHCVMADVHFLAPDGPAYLLAIGNKFELFEGRRCVARGEILTEQRDANRSLTA